VAEISVDASRLPVAWISGIDDDDFVEIARQPEPGGDGRRDRPDYGNVITI